jgi:hypothetical protein
VRNRAEARQLVDGSERAAQPRRDFRGEEVNAACTTCSFSRLGVADTHLQIRIIDQAESGTATSERSGGRLPRALGSSRSCCSTAPLTRNEGQERRRPTG